MSILRLPFYVATLDPDSDVYEASDDSGCGEFSPEREVDFSSRGNAWSSITVESWAEMRARFGPGEYIRTQHWRGLRHAPVFDVDREMDTKTRLAIYVTFPGHEGIDMVRSTHWWHVYVNIELTFAEYMSRLTDLADAGIVEPGYVGATDGRGASFVRKPHVRKRTRSADEGGEW